MIIGTAGHIDHGKTSLVQALTGVNADRLAEEKRRGITIDLGYAYMMVDNNVIGFVDVPGHERFVHNMLAGATGIDFVLLVIAANDGIKPQTIEHLQIIDLLGIQNGVVALTKADIADDALRAARMAEIQTLLAKTGLAHAPIIPTSTITGEGLEELKDLFASLGTSNKSPSGYPRLAIDRSFSLQGTGLIATGTLFAGEICTGDRVIISPSGIEARVRGLHSQNRKTDKACAGQRCALNIVGSRLNKDVLARGDWIVGSALHAPTSVVDMRLKLLASEKKPLKHWTSVHVHIGAAHVLGRVALLEGDALEPGCETFAQLVLDKAIGALTHDRVILRDQSAQTTLGGGPVIDPFATTKGRRKPERLIRLDDMNRAASDAAARLTTKFPGYLERKPFCICYNLRDEEAQTLWRDLNAVVSGPLIFNRDANISARQNLIETLKTHHEKSPDHPGLQPERVRAFMDVRLSKQAFSEILSAELKIGAVVVDGPWLRLPSHILTLSKDHDLQWRRIEQAIKSQRFRPPRVRDFATALEIPEDEMRLLMKKLSRLGKLIEVAHDHYYLRETVAEMIEIAAQIEHHEPSGVISAAAFRDRIDAGRKVAIQILEFFDKHGITIRRGDRRKVRPDRLYYFGQAFKVGEFGER